MVRACYDCDEGRVDPEPSQPTDPIIRDLVGQASVRSDDWLGLWG